jgi:hypothetical protein
VSAGGAPAARARRIIAGGKGIVVCPRVEDWRGRDDKEPLGTETEETCAVCGHPIVSSGVLLPFIAQGWAPICSYDVECFRHVLRHNATTPEIEAARREMVERYAARHGVAADEIVQVLPRELAWLAERGAA